MTIENNELAEKIAQANLNRNNIIELCRLTNENEKMKDILKEILAIAKETENSKLENGATTKYFIDRTSELLYCVLYAKNRIEHYLNSESIYQS